MSSRSRPGSRARAWSSASTAPRARPDRGRPRRARRVRGRAPSVVIVILSANVFVAPLRAIAIARAAAATRHSCARRDASRTSRARSSTALATRGSRSRSDVDLSAARRWRGPRLRSRRDDRRGARAAGAQVARARSRRRDGGRAGEREGGAGAPPRTRSRTTSSPFDQRGCLSPRVVLVEGEARASSFAELLDAPSAARGARVPRGALHEDERAEAMRYESTMAFAGRVDLAPEPRRWRRPDGRAPSWSPRQVATFIVVPVRTLEDARALIEDLAPVDRRRGRGRSGAGRDDRPFARAGVAARRDAAPPARRSGRSPQVTS